MAEFDTTPRVGQGIAGARAAQIDEGLRARFFVTHGSNSCYGFECDNATYVDNMLHSALSLHLPGS